LQVLVIFLLNTSNRDSGTQEGPCIEICARLEGAAGIGMCRNDHKCCVCLNFLDNQDTNKRDKWICNDCNSSIFPFVNIESEIDYLTVTRGLSDEECRVNLLNSGPFLNSMGTGTVNWNHQLGNNDIDPDNLFNGVMERDQYVDFNRLKLKM